MPSARRTSTTRRPISRPISRATACVVQALEPRRLLDGTLFSPEAYALPIAHISSTTRLRTGDLNGDGRPDVVTASAGSRSASVLVSRGDGAFRPAVAVPLVPLGQFVHDAAIGDVTGDGFDDLVGLLGTDSGPRTIGVIAGRADGTFGSAAASTLGVTFSVRALALHDVDGDGALDAVVAGQVSPASAGQPAVSTLAILSGNGDASFDATPALTSATGLTQVRNITSADMNGDGRQDLVLCGPGDGVAVLLALGGGAFATPLVTTVDDAGDSLAVGDFTNDGVPDVAVHDTEAEVVVLAGDGTGALAESARHPSYIQGQHVNAADLNGDGRLDLVVGSGSIGFATVLINTPAGLVLGPPRFDPAYPNEALSHYQSQDHRLADVNGDGSPDLLSFNNGSDFGEHSGNLSSTLTVSLNDGTGDFLSPTFREANIGRLDGNVGNVGNSPFADLIDVDGDGSPDVVQRTYQALRVSFGGANGRFSPAVVTPLEGDALASIQFSDLDGDGYLDAVANVGLGSYKSVAVALQRPGRTFAPFTAVIGLTAADAAIDDAPAVADVNGDGRPDLVSIRDRPRVLLGNGDGTFAAPIVGAPIDPTATNLFPFSSSVAGDISGDNVADLIVRTGRGRIGVAVGYGDGTFALTVFAAGTYLAGYASLPNRPLLTLADLTNDEIDEVVLAGGAANAGRVTVFRWLGGALVASQVAAVGNPNQAPTYVAVGDVTGDGHADVVVTRASRANYFEVYAGRGDATFDPARYFAHADAEGEDLPRAIVARDLNGDGRVDVAVIVRNQVNFALNRGTPPVDALAPTAVVASFDARGRSPVVRVTLDEAATVASVSAADLVVENLSTGQSFAAAGVTFGDGNRSLTFTLPATLPDGAYRFTLLAGAVADLAGNVTAAAASLADATTFVLAGDANRDRAVDFQDLTLLAQHYGSAGRTFAQGNFDYDAAGRVDFADLVILAQRYGRSVPLAAAVTTTSERAAKGRRGPAFRID